MYRADDIVILYVENRDLLHVGLIKTIIFKRDEVFFVIYKYLARRHILLQYFHTTEFDPETHLINVKSLADPKSLVKQGNVLTLKFSLHHHISSNIV